MIIFLYGPDTFRSSQKLNEIVDEYKTKHPSGLNFSRLDWSPGAMAELKNIFSYASIFRDKKLVIIKNACVGSKDDQDNLLSLLEQKSIDKDNDFVAVFFEKGTPQKSSLAAWLIKKAKMTQNFESLAGVKLNSWIKKEIERRGGQISAAAIQKLAACVGPDLWQANNEVDKLISFEVGKPITTEDIDLMVKLKVDPNIFATIDALASRNKNLAYKLLHQHLSEGENEIYLLTMFVYQFRNLLEIKSLAESGASLALIAKKTGLHPFVIKKSWAQIKNFSLDVLKKIYDRLLKLDLAIKRGKIEPQTALDLIVAETTS